MTTKLKGVLKRETGVVIRELGKNRALVVELSEREITLRLTGMQKRYSIALEPLWFKAVKQAVDEAAREKERARRARRGIKQEKKTRRR